MPEPLPSPNARGAFGIRLAEPVARLLPNVPSDWEPWRIVRRTDSSSSSADRRLDDRRATFPLAVGGTLRVERASRTATLTTPIAIDDEALAHPHLGPVAALAGHWRGNLAFHAGGLELGGRAYGLLGERGAGKSSTVAALAELGHGVIADDTVILDGERRALAGPRCVDLRLDARERFPGAVELGSSGPRHRVRVGLGPVAAETPFAGWFVLRWGDVPAHRELATSERLARLDEALSFGGLLTETRRLLDAASVPMWEITRPRRLEALGETVARMLALAG